MGKVQFLLSKGRMFVKLQQASRVQLPSQIRFKTDSIINEQEGSAQIIIPANAKQIVTSQIHNDTKQLNRVKFLQTNRCEKQQCDIKMRFAFAGSMNQALDCVN